MGSREIRQPDVISASLEGARASHSGLGSAGGGRLSSEARPGLPRLGRPVPGRGVPRAVSGEVQAPRPLTGETSAPNGRRVPSAGISRPIVSSVGGGVAESDDQCTVAMVSAPGSGSPSGALKAGKLENSGEVLTADPEISNVPAATLPVGMRIDDRYEILGVLGVGGFATVYRAHHLTIDRDVALKVMDLKKGVDPSYSERFFREAKIAAKIHHNNVVSIYDFGHVQETSQPYIAMEMLHGHDLSHELSESGPLSPQRAFVLFRPVLDALSEGHRLGIVHKDLKPENLYLVDPGGQRELMKILDFGVARINSAEVAKLTSAGQLLGTPRYLAPEYIKSQSVSPAIDVYQMALILSEALTGIPAVSGDPFHAMMLHCSGQLQISDFLLEGRVGEVFRKAIAIDPAERYPDCEAFGQAMDSIADCFSSTVPLRGGAPQMTPDSRTSSKLTAMPMSPKQATGAFDASVDYLGGNTSPQRRNKLPVIVISVLLTVLAVLVVVWLMVKKGDDKAVQTVAPVAEKPDVKLTFEFNTSPQGAEVLRGTTALCKTPCQWSFKQSELANRPFLIFKLDGHTDGTLELTEDVFNQTSGKVDVELQKALPKNLPFKFVYSPENAKVTEADSGKVVCKLSPCTYVFDVEKTAVTLTFSAQGYVNKNVALTAADHTESAMNIQLERVKTQPAGTRKATASKPKAPAAAANESPSSPPAEPKPSKKEEKPAIKLMF